MPPTFAAARNTTAGALSRTPEHRGLFAQIDLAAVDRQQFGIFLRRLRTSAAPTIPHGR
jgi:hypothetical protein